MDERWKKYKQSTEIESMRTKTMWSGSKTKQDSKEFVIEDGKFVFKKVIYTPTLKQMVTEVIANVLDLLNDTITLDIQFNKDGLIEITNTGNGIPVIPHPKFNDKYVPEICCTPHGGSNIDVDDGHVSAGTNGVGLKVVYTNSTKFDLLTSDTISRKLFHIYFTTENNVTTTHPYKIFSYDNISANLTGGFTKISFMPDYKHLDYPNFSEEDYKSIYNVILTQVYITKIYRPNLRIVYNNNIISIPAFICPRNVTDVDLYRATQYVYNQYISSKNVPFLFNVACRTNKHPNKIINFDIRVSASVNASGTAHSILIINGIYVNSSEILTLVQEFFKENLKSKVKKVSGNERAQTNNRLLLSYLNLIVIVDIPNKYVEPSSQIKDKISIKKEYMKLFELPDPNDDKIKKMLNTLWRAIKDCMENKVGKETKSKLKVNSDIHIKADKAGTSESMKCGIFIPEGKSPSTFVRNVLPNFTYYGIYILNGVISNALKKSKKVTVNETDTYIPKNTLLKDERVQKLWQVIGLEHDKHYGFDEQGETNYKRLNYGYICSCTDEDDDGVGHIFGLLTCYIETYWPELFKRKFLRRLITPIARVARKSNYTYVDEDNLIIEFYNRYDIDEWVNKPENKAKLSTGEYKLYYYKGLGTHQPEEHILVKKKFEDSIRYFSYTEQDKGLFDLFYGQSTANRKKELMTPIIVPSKTYFEWCATNKVIPAEYQFKVVIKTFQLITITRRQLRMIDGNNDVKTKILYTAKHKLKANRESLVNFMGSIAKMTSYHHGDISLYGACVTMARKYLGTNLIPLINPDGNYGDRIVKDSAASARYLYTSLNKITRLIFTDEDDELLQYEFEEKYLNPTFFVPIIPIILLNDNNQVGTGWNTKMFARDLASVINNIVLAIQGNAINTMPTSMHKYKGKIKYNSSNHECIVGVYEITGTHSLLITEIPLGKYANTYTLKLETMYAGESPIIKSIRNTSKEDKINIQITFYNSIEDMFEVSKWGDKYVKQLDPIEIKFNLYKLTKPILNLVTIDGFIKEYTSYEDIFNDWFIIRRDFYIKRIERQIIKMRAELCMYKNIYRFIDENAIEHMRGIDKEQQKEYLAVNGYNAIDTAKMRNTCHIYNNCDVNGYIFDKNVNSAVSYKYILDLKVSKMSSNFKNKTQQRIETLTKEIDELVNKKWNNFVGDSLWIDELKKLIPVLQQGLDTNWTFKKK